ncbi:MAG: DUF3418 domain-containing protein [Gammaproteobacteria bacterium]
MAPRISPRCIRAANQTPEPAKDREPYAQLEPFWRAWQATSESKRDEASAQRFRWLVEEFRVALFAQDLRHSGDGVRSPLETGMG